MAASTWSLTVDRIAVIKALIVIEEDVLAEVVEVDDEPAAPEELLVVGSPSGELSSSFEKTVYNGSGPER